MMYRQTALRLFLITCAGYYELKDDTCCVPVFNHYVVVLHEKPYPQNVSHCMNVAWLHT